MHLDHVIPWDFLKSDDLWNFVFSCSTCNISKSNRIPDEEYINKLVERNRLLKIDSPNIKDVSNAVELNCVRSGWKPRR